MALSRGTGNAEAFLTILRAAHLPLKLAERIAKAYDEEPAIKGTAFGVSQAITEPPTA